MYYFNINLFILYCYTHISQNKLINDPNRPKQPKIGTKIPKIIKNLYYGSAEKGYTSLHKSKNILTRKDDEDFWSLAIVQKLNCDSETIIIFFCVFKFLNFFNGGGDSLRCPPFLNVKKCKKLFQKLLRCSPPH